MRSWPSRFVLLTVCFCLCSIAAPFVGPEAEAQLPVTAVLVVPPVADSARIEALEKQVAGQSSAIANAQSAGDNAWMLVSAALVLMMSGPGLALFYGGLVRKKNVLGTM